MRKIQNAIILAAGRGKRMGALTDVVPKPMAPLHGSTLIAREIRYLRRHISRLHITVGYKKAMLAEHVIQEGVSSVFNTEGQSNSWWIFNTLLKHLNEPIYVLTCDNVTELDFDLLEKNYFDLKQPACMIVPVKPVAGLEGDYIFHKNGLVHELDRNKPSDSYCSGIQILNPYKVNQIAENHGDFYDVWKSLINNQQLMVSEIYPKKWISIDTLEQLASVGAEACL